jgi:predicted acylesterase/phospholipase RssA
VKNASTGQGRYFSCREGIDIHEVLRATKALPFFYGRKVNIGGELFLDSAFTITKEHGVSKAMELGATHILVLEINPRNRTRLQNLTHKIISRFSGNKPNSAHQSHEVTILRLGPDTNPAPPVTRNPDLLTAAYEKGYEDVRNHSGLRAFLEPFV